MGNGSRADKLSKESGKARADTEAVQRAKRVRSEVFFMLMVFGLEEDISKHKIWLIF